MRTTNSIEASTEVQGPAAKWPRYQKTGDHTSLRGVSDNQVEEEFDASVSVSVLGQRARNQPEFSEIKDILQHRNENINTSTTPET